MEDMIDLASEICQIKIDGQYPLFRLFESEYGFQAEFIHPTNSAGAVSNDKDTAIEEASAFFIYLIGPMLLEALIGEE